MLSVSVSGRRKGDYLVNHLEQRAPQSALFGAGYVQRFFREMVKSFVSGEAPSGPRAWVKGNQRVRKRLNCSHILEEHPLNLIDRDRNNCDVNEIEDDNIVGTCLQKNTQNTANHTQDADRGRDNIPHSIKALVGATGAEKCDAEIRHRWDWLDGLAGDHFERAIRAQDQRFTKAVHDGVRFWLLSGYFFVPIDVLPRASVAKIH